MRYLGFSWIIGALALAACAPAAPLATMPPQQCRIDRFGPTCPPMPKDLVGVAWCADGVWLAHADGRRSPIPDDFFGGIQVTSGDEALTCPS
jgi:hypothetical protein